MLLTLLSFVFALLFPVSFKNKAPFIPDDKKELYALYIKSYAWKSKKKQRKLIDGNRCANFHLLAVYDNLQVHHLTYKRLGDEDVKRDLITLCRKCHNKAHKKGK